LFYPSKIKGYIPFLVGKADVVGRNLSEKILMSKGGVKTMSHKRRVERLEERLNLNEEEKKILALTYISPDPDLEDFPYENNEDCKSFQRQIKEIQEKDPDKQVWIVTLHCKDCKEDCEFVGKTIGGGKGKK